MAIIKCKMCGGDLEILEDSTVCECAYCGTRQTVPSMDNEKKLTLFGRAGRLLRGCEFDKAAGVFETIVADFPEEAEAYWGLVLCKYGIEYVDDPASGRKIPTCHRSSFESVLDDPNFEQACENTDAVARRVYRDEARAIEALREQILAVSGREEPYDVFISYKETDDNGERTLDSVLAQDIYKALTDEGYRVFFSRISLEDKLGTEYEPYIFAALNSARVMLAVGTDYENYDSVWVKNEWSRFLKLIAKGEKKTLIPVFKNMDAYDMPKEFAKLAAQDMGKVGAMQDLVRGVEKIIAPKKAQPAPAAAQQPVVMSGGPNVSALLERGRQALEDADWQKANAYFDQVLNSDARCGEAFLGRVFAANQAPNLDAFVKRRLGRYASVSKTPYQACARDDAAIEKAASQYEIENYLTADTIRSWFQYDLGYGAEADSRQRDLETERQYLETDNLVRRAAEYLTGDQKAAFLAAKKQILTELENRVSAAKQRDEAERSSIEKAYAAFVRENTEIAASQYQMRLAEREEDYRAAVEAQEAAGTADRYDVAAKQLELIGRYQDAPERAAVCRQKAQEIRDTAARQAKKAKKKKNAIIAGAALLAAIVIIVAITVSNAKKADAIAESLNNTTWEDGTYTYICEYFTNTDVWSVTFNEDGTCMLSHVDTTDYTSASATGEDSEYNSSEGPYYWHVRTSGGGAKVVLSGGSFARTPSTFELELDAENHVTGVSAPVEWDGSNTTLVFEKRS